LQGSAVTFAHNLNSMFYTWICNYVYFGTTERRLTQKHLDANSIYENLAREKKSHFLLGEVSLLVRDYIPNSLACFSLRVCDLYSEKKEKLREEICAASCGSHKCKYVCNNSQNYFKITFIEHRNILRTIFYLPKTQALRFCLSFSRLHEEKSFNAILNYML
jgi:hypothetical protein